MSDGGYTCIMASPRKRLYVGVTSDLMQRVKDHKSNADIKSFCSRYNIHDLVYYEIFESINEAIARETSLKGILRIREIQLIVSLNPTWRDLSADWGKQAEPFDKSKLRPPTKFQY